MPLLRVDLQDGFEGDEVVVRLDGAPVFHGEAVRTRMQVGVAEIVETPVDAGRHRLEIHLPQRDLAIEREIEVEGATHVGVSRDSTGHLTVAVQETPFRYA